VAQVFLPPVSPPGEVERPPTAWWVDAILILLVAALAYGVVSMAALSARPLTAKVEIDLSAAALPTYAAYSTLRMTAAYLLAAVFSIVYARVAAASRLAERILIPILDILQSIPILSFMPGVVLGLVGLFPGSGVGLELSAIVLIFTSQAWNLAFAFHQSLTTIPTDLREAASMYRLGFWDRFTRLELPFGMIPFIWNSMMSWAGGWFFLMASEQFTLGDKDLRLPGLGSYLQAAANAGDSGALFRGLFALIAVVVALDLLIWRPLVAWSERFKVEQSAATEAAQSPVLTALRRSALVYALTAAIDPLVARLDRGVRRLAPKRPLPHRAAAPSIGQNEGARLLGLVILVVVIAAAVLGGLGAAALLARVGAANWLAIGLGALATLVRTFLALLVGVLWTVPVGVAIGLNPRWSQRLQPVVQIVASIPATAIFPVLLLILLGLPGGLSIAAVALMLLGTQWYLLFNVIAGAMAIPTDLREAASIYHLRGWTRWRRLILPAIFPYLVTGMITATGGAWNASIVAEYVTFGGRTYQTIGLGATISAAANDANFPVLLAGTLVMALVVVVVNRLLWRRLYRLAAEKYRLD
jgi:NitT/TauT family transport system permease protein